MNSLVFSNMLHRPARTFVSVFGIAVGILLIVFTVGMSNGSLRERATREGNVGAELMFRASGTIGVSGTESFRIPISMAKDLLKVEGVQNAVVVGQTTVSAENTLTGSRLIDGINFEDYAEMAHLKIIEGKMFNDKADEVLIDTGFQQQQKYKVGDKMKIWDRDFTIVGTYEPAAGGRVKLPLEVIQNQLGSENKCSAILVKIKDGFTDDQVGENLQKTFPDNQVIRTKDLPELYAQGVPFLNTFLDVVIGVASLVSALIILLTMYTTVTERTRQIGIMKALGMSKIGIAWIIVQEALLITFSGVVVGVILTFILRFLLSQITTLQVSIDPKLVLTTLVIGLIGGAIGALYPALRAARMDAVEALSYE
ncbi:MAG: ABC transporter permease [Pyrinomonadaceae bacterium]|nr:ABC transporter permease [Pyrinomonadaceae bacterium]